MNRTILINIILLCSMEMALPSCKPEKASAPIRPDNVPKDAVWSGGVDGGSWYLCSSAETSMRYYCEIYDDFTGYMLKEGFFNLQVVTWVDGQKIGPSRIDAYEILPYGGYSGYDIYLDSRLILVPEHNWGSEQSN